MNNTILIPLFMDDDGNYDFTFASQDDLQYISTDPHGFLADSYRAAAQAELTTRLARAITHHCPNCEATARELAGARGNVDHLQRSLHDLEDRFLKLQIERDEWESKYIASREHNEKLTTDNYRLAMVEQELADLKSDKAWDDKLSAENADELGNLRREHDALRAGILRVIEDYPRAIKQDAEEALRTLADGVAAPVSSNSDLRARLAAEAAEWRTEARYDKTAADIFDACADAVERIIAETEAK